MGKTRPGGKPDAAQWDAIERLLGELLAETLGEELASEVAAGSRAFQERQPVRGPRDAGSWKHRLEAIREAVRSRDRQLAHLQGQKDEVLSVVAHDLRTPLVAIQGFAQLLRRTAARDGLSPKQEEYLQRILQAVGALNRLVEDLLTARRLDQGNLPLRPRSVEICRFLDSLLDVHREAARQKEVAIVTGGLGAGLEAVFDPDRISQAVGNLVQNAVKFTPSGGQVLVEVHLDDASLQFNVCDQGPGIDPAVLHRLFERFTQGKLAETAGAGYGLGLFICREIACLHGGRVGAENRAGGGSRFWLRVPRFGPLPAEPLPAKGSAPSGDP